MRSICAFPECGKFVVAHGLCKGHTRQREAGKELRPIRAKHRPAIRHPEIPDAYLIPLTKGLFAIVDAADADAVAEFNWHATSGRGRTTYAKTNGSIGRGTWLHRFLWSRWGLPRLPELDHENTNGLDCRRLNLRAATTSQNHYNVLKPNRNTSGHKGVSWDKARGLWQAKIRVNGAIKHLGRFADVAEAGLAYAAAAREYHGEFARVA